MTSDAAPRAPYTVSELTDEIRLHLEERYDWVQVTGEISNFKKAPSGHVYFSLKDDGAVLSCVAWRGTAARWTGLELSDGVEVVAGGNLTIYPPRGQYQMVVTAIRLAGVGALQQRFEALKRLLAGEGLFDPAHKKQLPERPARIAVITSPTGAAVRDFIRTVRNGGCPVAVTVCPVRVQGAEAPGEIAAMIRRVNAARRFDLIVLIRGGGSLEDLWAFNEEAVARAIYKSELPVMTGVGHEIDFTIADFTADFRASTPTGAAQWLCESFGQGRADLNRLRDRLLRAAAPIVQSERQRLEHCLRAQQRYHPRSLLALERQRLDERFERVLRGWRRKLESGNDALARTRLAIEKSMAAGLERRRERIDGFSGLLHSYDPRKILERGFSVCRDEDGAVIRGTGELAPGRVVRVELADGAFRSSVIDVETRK